jgi:hypothetical protein
VFLASFLALTACGGPVVSAIDVPTLLVTHSLGRIPIPARALDAEGQELPDVAVRAIAVGDEAVARVGKDGSVVCESIGTTQVTLQADELKRSFELRCLLISAIKPAEPSLTLEASSANGVPLKWQVLDLAGQPVEGVPIDLVVADPSVVRLDGVTVFGLLPGRTTLTWTAGEITAKIAVRVGRLAMKHEGLVVAKGGTDVDMAAGEWSLTVSALDEVTVKVAKGRCSSTDPGKIHHLVCRPESAVKLHIEPVGLLREPTTAHVRGVFFPGS